MRAPFRLRTFFSVLLPSLALIAAVTPAHAVTAPPTMGVPVTNATYSILPFDLTLGEAASPGTARVDLRGPIGNISLVLVNGPSGFHFDWAPNTDPALLPEVASASAASLPDGPYNVEFSYQNQAGDPPASAFAYQVLLNAAADTTTAAPILSLPLNGTYSFPPVSYVLPEAPLPGSVRLALLPISNATPILITMGGQRSPNFQLNTVDLFATPSVVGASEASVPDGLYNVQLSYSDALGNPPANDMVFGILIDKAADQTTAAPTIFQPLSNATYTTGVPAAFQLGEPALPGSAQLRFQSIISNLTIILQLVNQPSQSFTIDPDDVEAVPEVVAASQATIPDGTYNVGLSYRDALGNPPAQDQVQLVTVDRGTGGGDTETLAPSLVLPLVNISYGILPVAYDLPETASLYSVKLLFEGPPLNITPALLTISETVSTSFDLNPNDLRAGFPIHNASIPILPNGAYRLTLSYQDELGNPAASHVIEPVIIDRSSDPVTGAPTLSSPAPSSRTNAPQVIYNLAEVPLNNTTILRFASAGVTRELHFGDDQSGNFFLDPASLASAPQVVSASGATLPDGVYDVTLSYQDRLGNPPSNVTNSAVQIDTTTLAPSLASPPSNITYGRIVPVAYTLPEAPGGGSVRLAIIPSNITIILANANQASFDLDTTNLDSAPEVVSASAATLPDGLYTFTLEYRDDLGNPAASDSSVAVRIDNTCGVDADCDDGLFCNGVETCTTGACATGVPPCASHLFCNEIDDTCDLVCPAVPNGACLEADKTLLLFSDNADPNKRSLKWLWAKGAEWLLSDLGDPTTSTDYALCGWAGLSQTPLLQMHIPASSDLFKAQSGKGYGYSDGDSTQDGVKKMKLKVGDPGKSLALIVGKGASLPALTLPLDDATELPVVLQLINSNSTTCVQTLHTVGEVKKNTSSKFKALFKR